MIKFNIFPSEVLAVLSEKSEGPMKYEDANRAIFFEKLGIDPMRVVSAHLEHGNNVAVVDEKNAGKRIEKTDGLISSQKNLFLAVTVADCLPVFLYDPEEKIVGLVHAGWRGLENNIIASAVQKFISAGSQPENILAAVGPGISPCHFEVQNDVAEKFSTYPDAFAQRDGKAFIDLKRIAQDQLKASRIKQIEISEECTFDNSEKFFSYRRDRPEQIQAMIAVIGMV